VDEQLLALIVAGQDDQVGGQRVRLRDDRPQPGQRHVGQPGVRVAKLDDAERRLAHGPVRDGDVVGGDDGDPGGFTPAGDGEDDRDRGHDDDDGEDPAHAASSPIRPQAASFADARP